MPLWNLELAFCGISSACSVLDFFPAVRQSGQVAKCRAGLSSGWLVTCFRIVSDHIWPGWPGTCWIDQGHLSPVTILLPLPPECWEDIHMSQSFTTVHCLTLGKSQYCAACHFLHLESSCQISTVVSRSLVMSGWNNWSSQLKITFLLIAVYIVFSFVALGCKVIHYQPVISKHLRIIWHWTCTLHFLGTLWLRWHILFFF